MATKAEFIETYQGLLLVAYPWTRDATRLARFIDGVRQTLDGEVSLWDFDAPLARQAWATITGKAKGYSLKALRRLA